MKEMEPSSKKESILAVDDAPTTLEVLERNLISQGYQVFTAQGVPEAITILETTPVDLVITDLKMPGVSGLDLIRHVRENFKETEVIMITGYPTVESAVKAVKTGAEEYLPSLSLMKNCFLPLDGLWISYTFAGPHYPGGNRGSLPPMV